MLILLLVVTLVQGRTVRYSNVPPHSAIATKTYDLEVPGSAPIRIIEAEPIWTTEKIPVTTPLYRDDVEHRSNRPKIGRNFFTTQPTRTTISEPVTHEPEHSTVYSPDALNTFLKEYAQRIKADRKKLNVENEPVTEEPINKLASIYLEHEEKNANEDDKSKSWGLVDVQHHKHPYEDKKGWVSLEAVPWSTSKISKWQSNNKNEPKPWEQNRPQSSNWHNKPSNGNSFKNPYFDHHNPNNNNNNYNNYNTNNNNNQPFINYNDKNYYATDNEDQYNPNDNIFLDKPVASYDVDIPAPNNYPSRPQYSRPSYTYELKPIKLRPESSQWPEVMPSRPSYSIRPSQQSQWNNKPVPDPWIDRNTPSQLNFIYNKDDNRDIITDGRPGDFPKPTPSYGQQPNHYGNYEPLQDRPTNNNDHPPSHPANGNGEWILVSTTRGYQYPRSKHQRSIEITPESIGTRRGIRLTVLPPDEDANVNMTTSHGGLLEVESTFETVEESQNKYTEIQLQQHNKTKPVRTKVKKPVKTQVVITPRPVLTVPHLHVAGINQNHNNNINNKVPLANSNKPIVKPISVITNKQDASAVLAAVGAGMLPATMAMLVPFVGRKKRSVETNLERSYDVTQVPALVYTRSY